MYDGMYCCGGVVQICKDTRKLVFSGAMGMKVGVPGWLVEMVVEHCVNGSVLVYCGLKGVMIEIAISGGGV